MGMKLFSKSCSTNSSAAAPVPTFFTLKRTLTVGPYVVTQANYPNCTNYEGDKIMLLKSTEAEVRGLAKLDPHFARDDLVVARFAPTDDGWNHAVTFAHLLKASAEPTATVPWNTAVETPQNVMGSGAIKRP